MILKKSVERLVWGTVAGYHSLMALDGKTYDMKFAGKNSDTKIDVKTTVNIGGQLDSCMQAYLGYEFNAQFNVDENIKVETGDLDVTNLEGAVEKIDQAREEFDGRVDSVVERVQDHARVINENATDYATDIKNTMAAMQQAYQDGNGEEMLAQLNHLCEIADWKTSVHIGKLYDTFAVLKNAAAHYAPSIEDFADVHRQLKFVERPVIRFFRNRGLWVPQGTYDKGIDNEVVVEAVMNRLLKV